MAGRETSDDRVSEYRTAGGIAVTRRSCRVGYQGATEPLIDALDRQRGVLLSSSYEYPGRYTRWDIGFCDAPLEIAAADRGFRISAANPRGRVLLPVIAAALSELTELHGLQHDADSVSGEIPRTEEIFPEELRSKQPSIFTVLRRLIRLFASAEDAHLGLYGAFGYNLAYQFDTVEPKHHIPGQRDLALFLPDRILVVDHARQEATWHEYDFASGGATTVGIARSGPRVPYVPATAVERSCDHAPGDYAATVETAKTAFRAGDLFEVVPGQTFYEACATPPSELFRRLRERNPAPYGLLLNIGVGEYLVGASPEMFVRVEGTRIETCPISGTIRRGADPIGDAEQILTLLNSRKDESELTMCTDVDRNDKSRVCEPGSVRVIGRRQIEMYSRLIHTVDHVEGVLRQGFDAIDGFLTHAWAVTVTGAPKYWAMRFIEEHEHSPRVWYGGAIGVMSFNGNMNTALTLRTIQLRDGVAAVRAGATLLYDSDAEAEEAETRLKAEAFLDVIRRPRATAKPAPAAGPSALPHRRILLIDHEDSFVHTLGDYFRRAGGDVLTMRAGRHLREIDAFRPELVVLSPGPGRPSDFGIAGTIEQCRGRGIPLFGVCLGLQGIVEYFGGRLGVLDYPMHGKPSEVETEESPLFAGLPRRFAVGRYHSLYALSEALPACLRATAHSDDGVIMAVEHLSEKIAAVQFHPESIMTLKDEIGMRLVRNVVHGL